jgi:hypothetical protein
VLWQVSLQPFSGLFDPLDPNPAGLLGWGEAACEPPDCKFIVNFADFLPAQPAPASAPTRSWSSQGAGLLFEVVPMLGVPKATGAPKPAPSGGAKGGAALVPATQGGFDPALAILSPPKNFYFRAIPTQAGEPLGPVSNTNTWRWLGYWDGPDLDNIKITDCSKSPDDPICKLPDPPPKPYIADILGYHGFIPPVNGHYGCFVVTETTLATKGFISINYQEGQVLCPPKPDEPNFLEAAAGFIVDAINWVSNAYNTLKSEIIDFVANFVPSELCDKTCIGLVLDATLAAMGIPPSIPNFDQLVDQGLDYLAETAVEQIGVPKEIQDLAAGPAKDFAIEEFKKKAKEEFKKGMQAGIKEAQKALSSEVSWILDGVPIKPDPLGDYQPPGMSFRLTRDANIPGNCTGNLLVWVTATNGTAEAKAEIGKHWANVYEQVVIPIPELEPGQSVVVPVGLKPYLSWGKPAAKYFSFNDAMNGWSKVYNGADAEIVVTGPACLAGDSLTTPATAILIGAQVQP